MPFPRGPRDGKKRIKNGLAPATHLTPAEWRFVEYYMIRMDPEYAAEEAGWPREVGRAALARPHIVEALRQARSFRAGRTGVTMDVVLRQWWLLATADVRELVELRIINCRHCWGYDNRYQFTKDELRRAVQRHREAQMKLDDRYRREFDDLGGDGFSFEKEPNPNCTECSGQGKPHVLFRDTRYFSESAKLLYDGVEIKKDGSVKLVARDRSFASQMVARHLGMFKDRKPITVFEPAQMSDEDLEAVMENLPPELRQQIEIMFENMGEAAQSPAHQSPQRAIGSSD